LLVPMSPTVMDWNAALTSSGMAGSSHAGGLGG
jgi:hypothetical protein